MPRHQFHPMSNDSDSDSDSDDNIPFLQPRHGNINDDSSSDDDDDDSASSMPGLQPRNAQDSSSDEEDAAVTSRSGMRGIGPFFPGRGTNINNNNNNNNNNDDSSSSDDSDGPPPLLPRNDNGNDTSSDDDDSIIEDLVPISKPQSVPKRSRAFANKLLVNQRKEKEAEEKRKKEKEKLHKANEEEREQQEREKKETEARKLKNRAKEKRAEENRKRMSNNAACTIATFFRRIVVRTRYLRLRSGLIPFQALWRGIRARRANAGVIHRVGEFLKFYEIWGNCLRLTPSIRPQLPDWASLRDQQAFIRQQELVGDDEGEERKETDDKLTSSMEDAMKVIEEKAASLEDDIEEIEGLPRLVRPRKKTDSGPSSPSRSSTAATESSAFKKIHLSGDVVKWLKTGDPRYVDFFVRRMKQLSSGERSRILAKRLNGSTTAKVPIYETYLEQKSGFRILWTEKDDYLLVWYVAKHHRVSRLMRLIDDSKNRSDRQRISINEADIDGLNPDSNMDTTEEKHEIFLDPLGNVPLKVYDVGTEDIENITKQDWTPALHLTEEERKVVETEGTVLLLGRSGTGKTICICNRMEYDRQQNLGDPLFSQLFIARSPRLCTYVKKNIGQREGSEFVTFERILVELENALPKVDGIRDSFPENLLMKFSTFQREVYDGDKGVDTLIVWTNIRSFLKGSIEALQNTSETKEFFVSHEEYLSEKNFGKKRCRLNSKTRENVYEIFLSYKQKLAETNAWDNCDRIVALIQRLVSAKTSHPELFEGQESWCKWSKIYVDEVQDYTQLEILLFFHLGGAGNLFLAGDPAQNVTKGVEFRFDDIRSVGYHIAGEDRRLIPQKPKIVNVNFRSHAGILNAAASILSQMFRYFPDSAKQLGRDDGLFKGPRPGMFHKVKPETLAELLSQNLNGTVVLTHDECVERVIKKLGGYELVYGIRRAKGLEFKSVIIIDFFSSLPAESQKPWRELLLNRDCHDFKSKHPQVEGQLKLLYTGVTRCIDRLFFAETSASMAGDTFLRFMTDTASIKKDYDKKSSNNSMSIATKNNINNIENLTMTQDEWLASGITNAEAAEAEADSDNEHARSLMEKALYCFRQADNDAFKEKSRIQLKSFEFRRSLFESDRLGDAGNSPSGDAKADAKTEKAGAELLSKLLKENLLLEARGLSRDMAKLLEKQYPLSPYLERFVVQQLPAGGGYKDAH